MALGTRKVPRQTAQHINESTVNKVDMLSMKSADRPFESPKILLLATWDGRSGENISGRWTYLKSFVENANNASFGTLLWLNIYILLIGF